MPDDQIRWGILGTGNIAHSFVTGLRSLPDAAIVAVGSRKQETADAFGDAFDIPNRHASYEDLANDPEVDVIYIGTPHPFHKANSLLCIEAGKAVLCEKPLALNAAEGEAIINAARDKGVFVMEAMWTRFTPGMAKILELLAEGVLGEPRMVTADFGFRVEYDPESRLFDPAMGGGALLDVGIYPVSLASMIFGMPQTITSTATMSASGVDEQAVIALRYPGGELAALTCAIRTENHNEAIIAGTKGLLRIEPPWWQPKRFTVHINGQDPQTFDYPFAANGYEYEAMEVMHCLRAGRDESRLVSHDETLANLRIMDTLRGQWGLVYPQET